MIIRAHDLQQYNVMEVKEVKAKYQIEGYQLALKKSFDIKEARLTIESIKDISQTVFDNTLILGAYFNPVDPDHSKVRDGIENFIFNMKLAKQNAIRYVGTETGSKMGTPWDYHPDNHLPETVAESTAAFKEIATRTKDIDVHIAIEPAYHHVINAIDSLVTMDKAIADSRLVYILDIYNLLCARQYEDYKQVLAHFLKMAGNKTHIVHLKDFIVVDGYVKQVKIGDGIVDFAHVINEAQAVNEEMLFVLEGTLEEDLENAMRIVGI